MRLNLDIIPTETNMMDITTSLKKQGIINRRRLWRWAKKPDFISTARNLLSKMDSVYYFQLKF